MHMYSDLSNNFTNSRNHETNATTQSPTDIQRILDDNANNDIYTVDVPSKLIISSQERFDRTGLSWLEEDDTKHFG